LLRIGQLNPQVNAIVTLAEESARRRAAVLDEEAAHGRFAGPLHGLPVVHKDLFETAGIRTTYGSPIFRDFVPDFSAPIVEHYDSLGAVTLGKTNTPEFGAGSQTFNPVFGATQNPFDLSKTCGGSSGGAAVALACGMAPIATGSDTGGSLRNPASFCSVVGFRPSSPAELNVQGPMARTVEDIGLMLGVAESLEQDCRGLRIGWCSNFAGLPFDRRVTDVFESSRKGFDTAGCMTEEFDPDFSGVDESFKVLRAVLFFQNHGAKLREHRSMMKETVVGEIERGARLKRKEIAQAEAQREALFARVEEWMSRYDFLLLPTVQVPPFDVEQEYVEEIEGIAMESYIDWMRSCYYISMTGLPAISVPAGFTPEGLPVGIQIVGRAAQDFSVLRIARAFEAAQSVKMAHNL